MYPSFMTMTEADGEDALHPAGWDQRLYMIGAGGFRFTKHTLALGDDLFLEENQLLEGSLRVDGAIREGRLQIALLQSENYRILGYAADGRLQTISYNGSKWDVAASAPGAAITFNASASLVSRILCGSALERLEARMTSGRDNQSLILPYTSQSAALETFIRGSIRRAMNGSLGQCELELFHEDLAEIVGALIDEIASVESIQVKGRFKTMYSLSRAVEDLLWECPTTSPSELNLDFVAGKFGCSRRYIQLALSGTFGVGFTALKRCVRLHQARRALRETTSSITEVAMKHEFEHLGRFAAYYKDFFGVLPGLDRSGARLDPGVKKG